MRNVRDLNKNEGIHCPTQEQSTELMKLFDSAGLTWSAGGRKYTDSDEWSMFSHNTVYYPADGTYCDLNYAVAQKDTVYPVTEFLPTKTNNTMATKVTILGEQPIDQEKKKIEFVIRINSFSGNSETTSILPSAWANIELVKPKETPQAYDIMFAYHIERAKGVIFLGHFNDGIV